MFVVFKIFMALILAAAWIFPKNMCASKNLQITIRVDNKKIDEIYNFFPEKTIEYLPFEDDLDAESSFSDIFVESHQRLKKTIRYTCMHSEKIIFKTRKYIWNLVFKYYDGVSQTWLEIIRKKSKDLLVQVEILDLDNNNIKMYLFEDTLVISSD